MHMVSIISGDGSELLACSSEIMAEKEELEEEEERPDLEPFFYDEAEAIADHERRLLREQEAARKEERRVWASNVNKAVRDSIYDYDPKQEDGYYYNRFYLADFSTFDLDEESPLGPMRHTDRVWDRYFKCSAVNILSVKIASLDVCFPVEVYGTVIARDNLDEKCVYLFRRGKDHCQLISSEDESLILTGPKRGLLLLDDAFVEIDLKIKDNQGEQEKELTKGFLAIRDIAGRRWDKCEVIESKDLATRLSTMEVMYAVVNHAVEASIAIEVLDGEFYGKITACTSSTLNHLVLHDSKLAGAVSGNGEGAIQLLRSIVCVCLEEKLLVTIMAQTDGDAEFEDTIAFTPHINGGDGVETTIGVTKMLVKVVWSLID